MQTNIQKNHNNNEKIRINYLNSLEALTNSIGNRSGMIINTPYKHLADIKKLMMVGYNPGGVPSEVMTSISEDFKRHLDDFSFNALEETWGDHIEGAHPIQRLYQDLINNTELEKKDIFQTNVYWQRSVSTDELRIDPELEKNCKKGFFLNIETHRPKSILFLGHQAAEVAQDWSDVTLPIGRIFYPWGSNQSVKLYSMKFDGYRVKAFSIPHPSRFAHGDNQDRFRAILEAVNKSDIELLREGHG